MTRKEKRQAKKKRHRDGLVWFTQATSTEEQTSVVCVCSSDVVLALRGVVCLQAQLFLSQSLLPLCSGWGTSFDLKTSRTFILSSCLDVYCSHQSDVSEEVPRRFGRHRCGRHRAVFSDVVTGDGAATWPAFRGGGKSGCFCFDKHQLLEPARTKGNRVFEQRLFRVICSGVDRKHLICFKKRLLSLHLCLNTIQSRLLSICFLKQPEGWPDNTALRRLE